MPSHVVEVRIGPRTPLRRLFVPPFYVCAPELAKTEGWPVRQWPEPEGPGASLTATPDLAYRFTDAEIAEGVAELYNSWSPPNGSKGKPSAPEVRARTLSRSEPPTGDGMPWW